MKDVPPQTSTKRARFMVENDKDDDNDASETIPNRLKLPNPNENNDDNNTLKFPRRGSNVSSNSSRFVSSISGHTRTKDEYDDEHDDGNHSCFFGYSIRFTILLMSTLCLASILSNILTFNFTFICMAGEKPINYENLTRSEMEAQGYREDLDYSSVERSTLFIAVAVGAILAVFPTMLLLNKYGARYIFGTLGFISAIATLLIPLAANTSFYAMIVARFVQGMAFSSSLPVMGRITNRWSTIKQNGVFIAILSSFLQIAPIFTMPVSGALCTSSLGWESVYYLHGIISLLLFTPFMLFHRNKPQKHPMVRKTELLKVMYGKMSVVIGPNLNILPKIQSKSVPYVAMYKDMAIWAIYVAAFGNFMGTQLSLQFMPTYINKVLHLPIIETGMLSAISPIIMFFIKIFAGQTSDKITFISDIVKLRIYNTLALSGMGTLFIILAFCDPESQEPICLGLLIASTCILGFNSGGFFKSSQMVSRQHSHFTMANISFINCVCMLIVPLLNQFIAPNNSKETWTIVLYIHGGILLVTNIFFCIFCSSVTAKWTRSTFGKKASNIVSPQEKKRSIPPPIIEVHHV